jgi:sortase A
MKQEGKSLNYRLLGSLLVLAGLFLLVYPYGQSIYQQWAYPQTDINPAEQTPLPSEPIAMPSPAEQSRDFLPISGRLLIPSLQLDVQVGYGVGEEDLKKGPGFYPQSGHPSLGNVSIAGHRNAYGSPFLDLNKLKPGDSIELYYDNAHYIYSVDRVYVTHSRDWSVVNATSEPAVTLTTCTPLHPADGHYDRLIVRGYLHEIILD